MKKLLGFGVLALSATVVSYGQAVSQNGGSIAGTITDASGAVLPNASIVVKGTDTGFSKTLTSDSAGFYSIGPLNPGNYKVVVSSPGFQTLSVNTVIRVGTATTGSFKLSIGSSSETVEVNAGAIQLNTEQAGVSDVLTSQQIDTLPINGRNFLDVAQIEPGVILQAGGSFDPTKAGYSALSVSGVSGRTTRILLDGQDITDETVGTTIFNVSQGAIGEFQLNRSTQDVSGDVTSTGQVLVTTKTGLNRFHGEGFYNFQDSRALFATEFGAQPPFQRNQFGGSLGGPILHDKLFFFGNLERIKQDSAQPAGVSSIFPQYQGLNVPSPYRETYSTIRLDYNGPLGGHYFVRANYNVNAIAGNFGQQFQTYANRDNTPGIAGGADYQFGRFTHSFRGSYEKFHNLISDTSSSATVNLLPGIAYANVSGTSPLLSTGPNVDAPQGTFQSDKQARYDGSWTKGAHTLRYGYSVNHILGGGFANFFGLGPRLRTNSASLLANCGGVAGAAPCPSDPLKGYFTANLRIGNNLGFFTENPGFGLTGGGVHDWREGAYVADSWKVTPRLNISGGLRWSIDTDRANQDVADIPCSALNTAKYTAAGDAADIPCSGTASLLGQFGPQYAGKVHQPYTNFAPQLGLAYSLPDQKTVLRAGIGIFFEGDVFNNTTNARGALLPAGPFFSEAIPGGGNVCGPAVISNPDGTTTNSATVNGQTLSIRQICSAPVSVSAPYILLLSQQFQAKSAANPISPNPNFIGNTLNATGIYGAPYRTPYSEQWNFGIQREIFKGGVLTADYVHNSTLKIAQSQDVNHVGAARYLNLPAAKAAIAATLASCGAGSVDQAIAACQTHPGGAGARNGGATISDFAGNGLDSGLNYTSGAAPGLQGDTVATGAAFGGQNPKLGSGDFLLPIGRSGYDALQIVFREQKAHPFPGIERSNVQISYNLSRIVSSSAGGSDQFFSNASFDNDNPNQYIGRASLDRKHQVSFGGSFLVKHGPQVGVIGHFYSAQPTNLTLDASAPNANIFQSDLTGDGTVGDLAPGTLPGDYMHRVKPGQLGQYIATFNSTYAGQLTPAGQALVAAGLLTAAQLRALNGVVQSLPSLPQAIAPANPMFRQVDVNFSYPIRLAQYVHSLGDSVMLEPKIAFYNVGNFSNFGSGGNPGVAPFAGDLGSAGAGSVNGPNDFLSVDSQRVVRQSGTFNQGAPRTTEFQLALSF